MEHVPKAVPPNKFPSFLPAGAHAPLDPKSSQGAGRAQRRSLLTYFLLSLRRKKRLNGLLVCQTKKTSGRRKKRLADKNFICQTKKTSGRRKKRLADEKNVWMTSKKQRSHPKPMKNTDLGLTK